MQSKLYFNWLLIAASIALLVHLGVKAKRLIRDNSEDGFLLAGRSLGPFVGAATIVATGFSGWAFLGSPAVAYEFGSIELLANFMFAPAMVFGILFFGNYLRARSQASGSYTIPELIANQHASGLMARILQGTAAVISVVMLLVFLISQVKALGLLSSSLLGLPINVSAAIMVTIIVIYTMTGGMAAIAWTDGVMVIGMTVGAIMIVIAIFGEVGLTSLVEELRAENEQWASPQTGEPYGRSRFSAFLLLPYAFLFTLCLPYMANRILSFRDDVKMRDAALIVALLACVLSLTPIAGLYARARLAPLDDPDNAMIAVIDQVVGPFAGGIIGVAVLFAVKSTANSLLHTISTAISHDLRRAVAPDTVVSVSAILAADRITVAVVGIAGILGMLYAPPFMLVWLGIVGTGTLLASFSAPVLMPALWQGNAYGALAALISGFVTSAALLVVYEVDWIVGPLLGCLISATFYVIVSLLTSKLQPRPELTP